MNQINSRYKIPGMQLVEVSEDPVFDLSAAQHVAIFLHGEIAKGKRQADIDGDHSEGQDNHVCTGMCENCSCSEA